MQNLHQQFRVNGRLLTSVEPYNETHFLFIYDGEQYTAPLPEHKQLRFDSSTHDHKLAYFALALDAATKL